MEVNTIAAHKSNKVQYRINENITSPEIRLIGADGNVIGVMPVAEALKISENAGLDLVEISPNANPPVCKIIDYGKFMFEVIKREKEARKKQKTIELKEIWLKMGIDEHDINFKIKNACKFLADGDKVKVSLTFRACLNKFIEDFSSHLRSCHFSSSECKTYLDFISIC